MPSWYCLLRNAPEFGHLRSSKRIEPARPRRARRQPGVERERNPGNGSPKRVSAPTGREECLGPIVPSDAAGCSRLPVGAETPWGLGFPGFRSRSTPGSQLARPRRTLFPPDQMAKLQSLAFQERDLHQLGVSTTPPAGHFQSQQDCGHPLLPPLADRPWGCREHPSFPPGDAPAANPSEPRSACRVLNDC
jgi:hypothetical protein